MHVCDGGLGGGGFCVHDVCGAAVRHDYAGVRVVATLVRGNLELTLAVDGHVQVLYPAVGAEDLTQVVFIDVLCKLLDDDLKACQRSMAQLLLVMHTFELRGGDLSLLALLSRLKLRL